MPKVKRPIDRVRASRDGHEYHEVWAARHAQRLLAPNSGLVGIAIEGLEPEDQRSASEETVEIADLVFYYGCEASFKGSDKVCISQFKYSIRHKSRPFRAADAKKTIEKFGKSFRSLKRQYGVALVRDKVRFEIHTNRPVYEPLVQALEALADGNAVSGEVKKQADQFVSASGLNGSALVEFASKCNIQSLDDTLRETKAGFSRTIVDWHGNSLDAVARASLGDLKQLVRDKAGSAGTDNNLIEYMDVLAALGVSDISDLLPCPEALADVGEIVEREQLKDAISIVPNLDKPLMVHAAGGVGKTVFMDSLRKSLADSHETLFFDCFGGGSYRVPGDARHHPRRGLIHIANTLARRGLCDLMIPGSNDIDSLINTFRRRIEQSVATLKQNAGKKSLILFIDAIDNASIHANYRHEDSFPVLLLEHLNAKPVPGFSVIVSSRSERIPIRNIPFEDFELRNFSLDETRDYLQRRMPDVREVEIRVAQARSQGNPRVLQYMLETGRGFLDESETDETVELNDLIQQRIDSALNETRERGSEPNEINVFLAGLAVLPPPVPIDEYAEAHGMEVSAIESFASDLSPLLERTTHGLIFRDEPTENLVRDKYASPKKTPLRRVAKNLLQMQDRSVYAARSLPYLLLLLGDSKNLFKLAFDQSFPEKITGLIGKRNIRLSRLKAATRHAVSKRNYDQLVELTVEMSTIAAVDRRGTEYILDFPDLVIASQDTDATRRLFEARTKWQGTRHARLTIANTLSGDHDEALRHALKTDKWLQHYHKQDRTSRSHEQGPEGLDYVSRPFFLLNQKKFGDAADELSQGGDQNSYFVCGCVFNFICHTRSDISYTDVKCFLDTISDKIGTMTAALAFLDLKLPERKLLLSKLAKAARHPDKIEVPNDYSSGESGGIVDGLCKTASIALALDDRHSAKSIARLLSSDRPGLRLFLGHRSDWYVDHYVFSFISGVALGAAINGTDVRAKDLMPREIRYAANGIPNRLTGSDFRRELNKRLARRICTGNKAQEKEKKQGLISYEEKQEAERFLSSRLDPLLDLTQKLSAVLRMPKGKADKAFTDLVKSWVKARKEVGYYHPGRSSPFFQSLGLQVAKFVLWARDDLKASSVKKFLKHLHEQETVYPNTIIELVSIFSKRPGLQEFAGKEARKCALLLESENEIDYKASLYAKLARAILPASRDESSEYFRTGLEQMDAIGSGDYQYANHLFIFAASTKGRELKEADFHTLTNIAELNLTVEPEKFPWFAFGQGMSRVSGCKGLAKLSRWDDRDKITLDYTLRPYLTALVSDEKINPEDALALNWLADPAEYRSCNTETFAKALDKRNDKNSKQLVSELIAQYEANNPGVSTAYRVKALAEVSRRVLGAQSKVAKRLNALYLRFDRVNDTLNEYSNYRPRDDLQLERNSEQHKERSRRELIRVAENTRPADQDSLCKALEALKNDDNAYSVRDDFLDKLRANVRYGDRAQYIQDISESEHLNLFWKLEELKTCNKLWSISSVSLKSAYRDVANALMFQHLDDFISHDSLSTYLMVDISELSGISLTELSLELLKFFSESEASVGSPVWLDLGCIMCEQAAEGTGQAALTRLLRGDATKISEGALDGKWTSGLYPENNHTQIFAGLIWRQLGSPRANDRWRAAHCIRSFARFGKWQVIDALLARLGAKDAGPFQAPELTFYYLHARLWLLIAIARISKEYPTEVSRYKAGIGRVIDDQNLTHILIKHFAAQALMNCIDAGKITVSAKRESELRNINESPFPPLHKKLKEHTQDFYHDSRLGSAPGRSYEFSLEYDFSKLDVHSLSNLFGQPHRSVVDLISDAVQGIDPCVKSMSESDGRDEPNRSSHGLSSAYHTYGEQLAWHGMMIAAGELQRTRPVTEDCWHDGEPWKLWLERHLLTRDDGYWLSDAVNPMPHQVTIILMEKTKDGLELTGDKQKILGLAGLDQGLDKGIVVAGHWFSADHIRVQISSVLVRPRKAKSVIKELLAENPMVVQLPSYEVGQDGKDYLDDEKDDRLPWIAMSTREPRLDGADPFASTGVIRKPRISLDIADSLGLRPQDSFDCKWTAKGGLRADSEAWAYSESREGSSGDGKHLVCNKALLAELLARNDSDLLLLIGLQKYQSVFGTERGKYWNTVAVIRIKKSLKIEYHKGSVNQLWIPRW